MRHGPTIDKTALLRAAEADFSSFHGCVAATAKRKQFFAASQKAAHSCVDGTCVTRHQEGRVASVTYSPSRISPAWPGRAGNPHPAPGSRARASASCGTSDPGRSGLAAVPAVLERARWPTTATSRVRKLIETGPNLLLLPPVVKSCRFSLFLLGPGTTKGAALIAMAAGGVIDEPCSGPPPRTAASGPGAPR